MFNSKIKKELEILKEENKKLLRRIKDLESSNRQLSNENKTISEQNEQYLYDVAELTKKYNDLVAEIKSKKARSIETVQKKEHPKTPNISPLTWKELKEQAQDWYSDF